MAAARAGPGLRARARLLLRLGPGRTGDVRHRATRHRGHVGADRQRRARRRRCSRPRCTRWSTRASTSATCRHACAPRRRRTSSAQPDVSGPRCAGHHLQPRLRVAAATTRPWWSSSIRTAAALWGISSLHADVVRAARLRDPRDQSQPPPGHARRRRARAGRARGRRHRHRELARHRGPARAAHHRALVPPAGAADDPQRDRAVRRRWPTTCPTVTRWSTPTRAPTRSAGRSRARLVEVPHVSGASELAGDPGLDDSVRPRRHRHRRVEGRRTRHRAPPRAAAARRS